MSLENLSDRSFNEKEDENSLNSRQEDEYFGNKTMEVFDHAFIKSNFCPVKLSRSDIKNLSSDFADQTLGGHREYREEIIDGRLAKVYVYKIKIIKYENEVLEIKPGSDSDSYNPLIIVENNLIVPFNTNLVINKQIAANKSPLISPYEGGEASPVKRGRPRKYPKGEEPYKLRKKAANRYYDEIPERPNMFSRRPSDSGSIFNFQSDYEPMNQNYNYSKDYPQSGQSGQSQKNLGFDFSFGKNEDTKAKRYDEQENRPNSATRAKNANIDDFLSEYINNDIQNQKKNDHSDKYNQYSNEYF